MLPSLPTKAISVDTLGEVTIRAMSARCYVDMLDARAAEKSETEVAALVAMHCVEGWREHTADEILEAVAPQALAQILSEVIVLGRKKKPTSGTGPVAVSS